MTVSRERKAQHREIIHRWKVRTRGGVRLPRMARHVQFLTWAREYAMRGRYTTARMYLNNARAWRAKYLPRSNGEHSGGQRPNPGT